MQAAGGTAGMKYTCMRWSQLYLIAITMHSNVKLTTQPEIELDPVPIQGRGISTLSASLWVLLLV